jgi:hypothetical protein
MSALGRKVVDKTGLQGMYDITSMDAGDSATGW